MDLFVVDAFARRPFEGNPAAVVPLAAPADAAWMQRVAAEMKHSETAFLHPAADGAWALRWFTPAVEVDLCGHATLAAAHVLFESGRLAAGDAARFDTRSGRLTVHRTDDGLAMDFPATPPAEAPAPDGLAAVLGIAPVWTGRSRFDVLAVVPTADAVRDLVPDHAAIAALGMRGLIVTARAERDDPYDVVSRFFAPGAGVPEDPVTGSAHCALGPYWAGVLRRDHLVCRQASPRGGTVGVTVRGDRVTLAGSAVTVVQGTLLAGPDAVADLADSTAVPA